MEIPSERDWGDWRSDLDQIEAHKNFFGKSIAEVEGVFSTNPIERSADLRFMPAAPFQYYIRGFTNFLCSPKSEAQSDAASSYLSLVEDKIEKEPETIAPVLPELLSAIRTIAGRQTFYVAENDIYGDFQVQLNHIVRLYDEYRAKQR